MLYIPLDFKYDLKIDALVGSKIYVSTIAEIELDGIEEQLPANILKMDDTPNFETQVANDQLENLLAIATAKLILETILLQNVSSQRISQGQF